MNKSKTKKTVKLEKCKTVNVILELHKKLKIEAIKQDKLMAELLEEIIVKHFNG